MAIIEVDRRQILPCLRRDDDHRLPGFRSGGAEFGRGREVGEHIVVLGRGVAGDVLCRAVSPIDRVCAGAAEGDEVAVVISDEEEGSDFLLRRGDARHGDPVAGALISCGYAT